VCVRVRLLGGVVEGGTPGTESPGGVGHLVAPGENVWVLVAVAVGEDANDAALHLREKKRRRETEREEERRREKERSGMQK
jgi:hypothetical protein